MGGWLRHKCADAAASSGVNLLSLKPGYVCEREDIQEKYLEKAFHEKMLINIRMACI